MLIVFVVTNLFWESFVINNKDNFFKKSYRMKQHCHVMICELRISIIPHCMTMNIFYKQDTSVWKCNNEMIVRTWRGFYLKITNLKGESSSIETIMSPRRENNFCESACHITICTWFYNEIFFTQGDAFSDGFDSPLF